MSKLSDTFKKNVRGIHKNSDGSWGTDDHDGDILKGIAAVFAAIGTIIATVNSSKKK